MKNRLPFSFHVWRGPVCKACKQALHIACLFFSLQATAETIRLTVPGVVERVIEQNLDIQRTNLQVEAAKTGIAETKGAFDTFFQFDAAHRIDQSRQRSSFFGNRTDSTTWDIGFSKKLPSGTKTQLSFQNLRQKTFGSPVIAGAEVFPSAALYHPRLEFSLSQPILKNAFGLHDRRAVSAMRLAYEALDFQSKHTIQQTIFRALANYWSALIANRRVAAMERSVADAKRFLQTARRRRNLGTADETDVLSAEADVARRQGELFSFEALAIEADEALRNDLVLSPSETVAFRDELRLDRTPVQSLDDHLSAAFRERADYQGMKKELETKRVRLQMAGLRRYPELDVVASMALNEIDRKYTEAFGGIDKTNWAVGVNFRVPLENRVHRAQYARADAEKAMGLVALKALEIQIANAVRRGLEEVRTRTRALERLQAAEDLERKKVEAELGKYEQGRSRAELVLRFQDDAIHAKLRTLEGWHGYLMSVLQLKLAEGAVLR